MPTFHFGHCLCQSPHLLEAKSHTGNHVSSGINRYICYSPLNNFWSSYRKLAWMGFEPMTTEFGLYALTDRAIRPWVQLALWANFMQLLQFQLFAQYSRLVLVIVFVSRHICFKNSLAPLITLVAEWIDTYDIHNWRIFEVAIENWPEWDFYPRLLNSVQMI